jgi:hypothetical protein
MKIATLADVMNATPEVHPIHPALSPRRRLPLSAHEEPPCYRLFYGTFMPQPDTIKADDPADKLTEALAILRWHTGYVLAFSLGGYEIEFLLVDVESNSGDMFATGCLSLFLAALVYAPRALPVRRFWSSSMVLNDLPDTHYASPCDNGFFEWHSEERQRTRRHELTPDNWRGFINTRRMARGGLTY